MMRARINVALLLLMACCCDYVDVVARADNEHILYKPVTPSRGKHPPPVIATAPASTAAGKVSTKEAGVERSPDRLATFSKDMSSLCRAVRNNIDRARRVVSAMDFVFCIAHGLVHKRQYDPVWDSGASGTRSTVGYYRGVRYPPYQPVAVPRNT